MDAQSRWPRPQVQAPVAAALQAKLKEAVAFHQQGKLADAARIYREILQRQPNDFDALHLLGVIAAQTRRTELAVELIEKAIGINAKVADAHSNRGNALRDLKRFEEALASYDRALVLKPDYAEAFNNRGIALKELNRVDEALASYDKALVLKPDYAEAFYNRGIALQELNRVDEALASYDKALVLKPDYAKAFNNRGSVLKELNRFDEALASYDKALAFKPDCAEAHWNEALLRLLTGDFSRGWAKYEWRWRNESLALSTRNLSPPLWLGAAPIDGKTILLHSEQGFGDTIQFCRYVPLVAARCARVILEVERPLQKLMTNLAGATQVISKGDSLPDFDVQCPFLSLPLAFATRLETIPSATPYLRAPVQALKNWQARLGPKARPRIGLAWSGRPTYINHQNRSIRADSVRFHA